MSAPLVLYGANALAGYKRASPYISGRTAKRARIAVGIAKHMYRNRGKYRRAAKIIGRAWRRRKTRGTLKKAKRGYGPQVSTAGALKVYSEETLTPAASADRNLYSETIIFPNEGVSTTERDQNTFFFSGVKVCAEFSSTSVPARGLYVNFAIIQPRDTPKSKSAIPVTRFFRGEGNGNRGEDFPLAHAIENHCRPINTDLYRVFYHWRRQLAGANSTFQDFKHSTHATIQKYIPIKKTMTVDSSNFSVGQLHFVYWFTEAASNRLTPLSNVCASHIGCTLYFRNKK